MSSSIRALMLLLATSTLLVTSRLVFAEGTRTWEQSKFDDLSKGTAKGVAIRSTGGLELAPALKSAFVTPSTYIWSIAADGAGTVFAATGAPARIYRITPDGSATIIFEPKELQVQAILVAKSEILYAATAPDGKVYKIEHKAGGPAIASSDTKPDAKAEKQDAKLPVDASWTASVFFDPGTRYIWDLALDASGNLFVATGDGGEVFKVTPSGAHSSFFKSDETHIRKLAFDNKGNLVAGSDGSGLIYRISPAGEAFVLYSAAKKEITALAVDKDGAIYAAGVGEKRAAASTPGAGFTGVFGGSGGTPGMSNSPVAQAGLTLGGPTSPMPGAQFPFPALGAGGGSEVYRIATDGSPLKIWSSREDIVYALAFDQHGRLLAGTGNRGHVFALDGGGETGNAIAFSDDKYSDLLKATATQVTAFAQAPAGGLYAATSNLGKLFLLSAAPESEGTYESDIFDAHNFSRFGRIETRSKGNVELFARSGNVDNPDRNWSAWKHLDSSSAIDAPPARFLQWKAVLHSGTQAPVLESVLVNYLPKNVAPQIEDISIQLGVRYQPLPKPANTDITLNNNPGQPRFDPPPPTVRDPDSVGVKWTAHDDNDDQLTYKLYYRGDGESRWLLLKDSLTDKFYSFDASLLPDDGYTFKVVASDAPSHSPGDSLSVEKESLRVEIDTTPPNIENLTASLANSESATYLHVMFRAVDRFSTIKRAEYSIDAGDWQFIEPVSKLSDAKTENYDFRGPLPSAAASAPAPGKPSAKKGTVNDGPIEHVIVVRVYDRYDNLGTAKYVVRGK